MNRIASVTKLTTKFAKENSPIILTGIAVAGVATTAIMAATAVPKALQILDEAREEKGDLLTTKEQVLLTWHCFIPAAGVGIMTIICIIGATSINNKRNATLVSAFTLSEKAFREYQAKVVENVGEKGEAKVRTDVVKDRLVNNPPPASVIFAGDGDVLFYEVATDRYFPSTVEKVRSAMNDVNAKIIHEDHASLSDFYYPLGVKSTGTSDDMGWNTNKFMDIIFDVEMADGGKPCIAITYSPEPIYKFWKQG
jgi:hypothetical protein